MELGIWKLEFALLEIGVSHPAILETGKWEIAPTISQTRGQSVKGSRRFDRIRERFATGLVEMGNWKLGNWKLGNWKMETGKWNLPSWKLE